MVGISMVPQFMYLNSKVKGYHLPQDKDTAQPSDEEGDVDEWGSEARQ